MIQEFNISQGEYRNDKRLSYSDCKAILEDPYSYKLGIKKPKTKALDVGSLAHAMVLEPGNVERDFLIIDRELGRSAKDKEILAEYEDRAIRENKILIHLNEFEESKAIADSVLSSEIGAMFKNGFAEKSFFGDVFGMPCKCRPDYYLKDEGGIIIDFKTTKKGGSDPKEFARSCASFMYHMQARFYLELLRAQVFIFVVVEKEAPYRIGVYQLGQASLEVGAEKIRKAFEIFKNLDKIQQVRTNDEGLITQVIDIPSWAFYD